MVEVIENTSRFGFWPQALRIAREALSMLFDALFHYSVRHEKHLDPQGYRRTRIQRCP
jgi:hypothetical protein